MLGVVRRRVAAPAGMDGEHRFSGSAGGSSTVRVVSIRHPSSLPPASGGGWKSLGFGSHGGVHRGSSFLCAATGVDRSRAPSLWRGCTERYGTTGPSRGAPGSLSAMVRSISGARRRVALSSVERCANAPSCSADGEVRSSVRLGGVGPSARPCPDGPCQAKRESLTSTNRECSSSISVRRFSRDCVILSNLPSRREGNSAIHRVYTWSDTSIRREVRTSSMYSAMRSNIATALSSEDPGDGSQSRGPASPSPDGADGDCMAAGLESAASEQIGGS